MDLQTNSWRFSTLREHEVTKTTPPPKKKEPRISGCRWIEMWQGVCSVISEAAAFAVKEWATARRLGNVDMYVALITWLESSVWRTVAFLRELLVNRSNVSVDHSCGKGAIHSEKAQMMHFTFRLWILVQWKNKEFAQKHHTNVWSWCMMYV